MTAKNQNIFNVISKSKYLSGLIAANVVNFISIKEEGDDIFVHCIIRKNPDNIFELNNYARSFWSRKLEKEIIIDTINVSELLAPLNAESSMLFSPAVYSLRNISMDNIIYINNEKIEYVNNFLTLSWKELFVKFLLMRFLKYFTENITMDGLNLDMTKDKYLVKYIFKSYGYVKSSVISEMDLLEKNVLEPEEKDTVKSRLTPIVKEYSDEKYALLWANIRKILK